MAVEGEPAVLDGLAEGALVLEAVDMLVLQVVETLEQVGKLHAAHRAGDLAPVRISHREVGEEETGQIGPC
jgi:hypothetical protein